MALRSTAVMKIHDATGRTVAGLRRADLTLQKTITSRHILRSPVKAIAFDVSALDEAQRAGAERVEVEVTDTHTTYRCALADFLAKSFKVDRGFGEQRALALTEWNKPDAMRQLAQLDLWGGRG